MKELEDRIKKVSKQRIVMNWRRKAFIDCAVSGAFLLIDLKTYEEFSLKMHLDLFPVMQILFLNIFIFVLFTFYSIIRDTQ
jgi:hypothetical protein